MRIDKKIPKSSVPKLLVFSDIDGTFADDKMVFNNSIDSVKLLKKSKGHLILSSSKPAKSIYSILESLHLNEPFVFENGGGVYIPRKLFNLINKRGVKLNKKYSKWEMWKYKRSVDYQ